MNRLQVKSKNNRKGTLLTYPGHRSKLSIKNELLVQNSDIYLILPNQAHVTYSDQYNSRQWVMTIINIYGTPAPDLQTLLDVLLKKHQSCLSFHKSCVAEHCLQPKRIKGNHELSMDIGHIQLSSDRTSIVTKDWAPVNPIDWPHSQE